MSWRPGPDALRVELGEVHAYRVPEEPIAVRLDANESPFPLPPEARALLAERIGSADLHRYPEIAATELRAALCRRFGARPDELVLGVGSDEAIVFLASALSRPRAGHARGAVVVPAPTFSMYAASCRLAGLDVVPVPYADGFALDVPAMLAAIAESGARLAFIATPNNPTGNAQSDATLEALVRGAPDTLIVIDEAYAAYRGKDHRSWLDRFDNVALLGTLSKIGMAALRVGWARCRPELAAELEKVRLPYNLALPSQVLAATLLGELEPVIDGHIARVVEERARVLPLLGPLGVSPHATDANFALVECGDDERAAMLYRGLLDRGIRVRAFAGKPVLSSKLRITIGTPDENDQLLAALATL
jgi:histidinol-phosphate aminotransferase